MVNELRLVVTVDDYDEAVDFYRDVLGLREQGSFTAPNGGRVCILEAGRATLELANAAQADYIDEGEGGHRGAGEDRVAFEVTDADGTARRLAAPGARGDPQTTPPPGDS